MRRTPPKDSRQRRRLPSRAGTATVELAVTLPILITLIFGSLEFSRANTIRNTIENAAYEAARTGMLPGGTVAKAEAEGQKILDAVGVQSAVMTFDPPLIVDTTPRVTVTIRVPFEDNAILTPRFMPDSYITTEMTLSREIIGH